MNEVEAIAQTIDALLTVDLPRLIAIFVLLLVMAIIIIVIVFWRISNNSTRADSQQWKLLADTMGNLNDYLRTEQGTNRAKLDLALDEIRANHRSVMQAVAAQNTATEGLLRRFGELFTIIDDRLETMRVRTVTTEAETKDRWQQITQSNEGLKSDMSDVKNGTEEILAELRKLTAQIKRLADNWETSADYIQDTMKSVQLAVEKLSKSEVNDETEDTNA